MAKVCHSIMSHYCFSLSTQEGKKKKKKEEEKPKEPESESEEVSEISSFWGTFQNQKVSHNDVEVSEMD